jgi:hypothetical protein
MSRNHTIPVNRETLGHRRTWSHGQYSSNMPMESIPQAINLIQALREAQRARRLGFLVPSHHNHQVTKSTQSDGKHGQ